MASLGQSLVGSLLLSSGSWYTQGFACALQNSVSPVLCKFCQLYGGVNGDLLQEGLCLTQVCCTQSPRPCSSPLLTCTSTGDTQTQFYLSLCGVSGSWCAQGLFVLSQRLWRKWGLILNSHSPPAVLLGFSSALVPCCCPCCCVVAQLCPTLCDPVDCSPPGCSVHGDSPGENTGVGCHFLLQEIFPTPPLSLICLIFPVSLKT